MLDLTFSTDSLTFSVYVQPRASRLGFAGGHQQALKILLTAPPADGAANKQCIQVLAKALGLAKSAIAIVGGQTSRNKRIRIAFSPPPRDPAAVEQVAFKLRSLYETA
jgi:uncharacterized protein (TIGR00251 family)